MTWVAKSLGSEDQVGKYVLVVGVILSGGDILVRGVVLYGEEVLGGGDILCGGVFR